MGGATVACVIGAVLKFLFSTLFKGLAVSVLILVAGAAAVVALLWVAARATRESERVDAWRTEQDPRRQVEEAQRRAEEARRQAEEARQQAEAAQRRVQDRDPYEVLGLRSDATLDDVRTAHRRLAKKHHPDKNPGDKASEWIFREVQQAWEVLRERLDLDAGGTSHRDEGTVTDDTAHVIFEDPCPDCGGRMVWWNRMLRCEGCEAVFRV